jgi:RNA polymerase sigma-70 factor (sigma-E family)
MTTAGAADFDGFYQAHFHNTVAITYGYTGDLAEAQDIAQEAFSRAWQRWKDVSTYDNPVYWVRRVATNLAHSRWRRLKVASAYLVRQRIEDLPGLSPDSVDLVNALKQLPVNHRQAIVLHYLLDLPVDEIAEELSAAPGTVKSWLHRGRLSLSTKLADDVRRSVAPAPVDELREKSQKQQGVRRTAAAVAAFLAVIALGLGLLKYQADREPNPPATPSPTGSPSPGPGLALPQSCLPKQLPLPSGFTRTSLLTGGDPSARYLTGKSYGGPGQTRMLIWANGSLAAAFAAPGENVSINDVNSRLTAVGESVSGDDFGDIQPWVYLNGELQSLKGERAAPRAINEAGQIAGWAGDHPVTWQSPAAEPERLPLPPGYAYGWAVDLSESGTIIGVASPEPRSAGAAGTRIVAWKDGKIIALLEPPSNVAKPYKFLQARMIRGDLVLGSVYSDGHVPLIWDLHTGQASPAGADGDVLNQHGWTVQRGRSFLADRSNVMAYSEQDGSSSSIVVLSDDGQLMAGSMEIKDSLQAFLWTCHP